MRPSETAVRIQTDKLHCDTTLLTLFQQALAGPCPPPATAVPATQDHVDAHTEQQTAPSSLLTTQSGLQQEAAAVAASEHGGGRSMSLGVVPDNRF